LVTPLTRRTFKSDTQLSDSLANKTRAIKVVASSAKFSVINLNTKSEKYVEAIGYTEATKYHADYQAKSAGNSKDNTHLNKQGFWAYGCGFDLEQIPEVGKWFKQDGGLSEKIKEGKLGR
jgi:hypothetical protein